MAEYRKYNPTNIAPEHFLQPPTQVVKEEARYLTRQVSDGLESPNVGFLQFLSRRGARRDLRIGTEFEVIFFSQRRDPWETRELPQKENPNYKSSHLTR